MTLRVFCLSTLRVFALLLPALCILVVDAEPAPDAAPPCTNKTLPVDVPVPSATPLPTAATTTSAPTAATVTSVSPLQANDGSVTWMTVLGKGLKNYDIQLCPSNDSVTVKKNVIKPGSDSALYSELKILPGVDGSFDIDLKNDKDVFFSGKRLTIFRSERAYVRCGQDLPFVSTNGNLSCNFVPLTYDATKQAFGKGIADRFLVVQLTVRNLNRDMEFLFQDVRLGTPQIMQGSLDRKIVRGIAEKTEQFSSRAVAFRLTQAAATTLGGIAGFVGNDLLTSASSLLGGPVKGALIASIPDLTAPEIARIDDLGFTTLSTVVPKNSSIPVVAFLSFRPLYYLKEFKDLEKADCGFWRRKCIPTEEHRNALLSFWNSLQVEIAGIHVQHSDINSPSIKAIVQPNPANITTPLEKDAVVIVSGSGFTSVASVSMQPSSLTDSKQPVSAKFEPLPPQQSIDDNIAQVVIPKSSDLKVGSYTIVLTTKDGVTSNTGKAVDVVVAAGTKSALSPTHGAIKTPVTITGTGFGTTEGTVKFNGISAPITNWTDKQIVVQVPDGAQNGDVIVTVGGVDTSVGKFTVDPATGTTPHLSPPHAAVKASVTITGTGFGTTKGTVKFKGISAPITSWTDKKIVVQVPNGAHTGNVVVTARGVDTGVGNFTVP